MAQSSLRINLAQEIDDALERGGGAVRLPLDAREDRNLDLRVGRGHRAPRKSSSTSTNGNAQTA